MATFKIYRLHFTAPLHISDQHEDDDSYSLRSIHSDTLYAALVACLAKTGNPIPADGDLGFTVSSLFPYYQRGPEDKAIYFLPMPMLARQAELADVSMAKKVKKVQWVDSALYGALLSGCLRFCESDRFLSSVQGAYLTAEQLPEDADGSCEFVKSEISQRVRLESRTGERDAEPYYVDRLVFRYHSGLYFMAEGNTEPLDKALAILSVEGLGTDRNIGFGFFEFTTDTLTIDTPEGADHQMALSLLIPASEEQLKQLLSSDTVAYDFARRGGWITTYPYMNLRKNAIYGFLPGSVFHKDASQACESIGRIVDLKPEVGDMTPHHPIWRNGKSMMLPIKLK